MKVIIADDHAVVRKGLKQILLDMPGINNVEEVNDGNELIERIKKEDFNFVILDISMPGKNGLDVLKDIKTIKPQLPVLILSIHPEGQYAIRALKAGAAGYLTKDSAPEELITAIQKILTGRKYITQSLAEKLAYNFNADSDRLPHEYLSDREFEVFKLIASGKTITDIAGKLCLSVNIVSTYRARIYEKTNLKSRSEITLYAIKNGLIE